MITGPAPIETLNETVELLTVDEVARRLKMGRSTVYLLCKNKELPHVTIHRCVRIPADALAKWLRSRTNDANGQPSRDRGPGAADR
jgi:excisionase family DNA binding protein